MSYTTILVSTANRDKLAGLKEYRRESYDEVVSKLVSLVPEGDEEGAYRPAFRASVLQGLLDAKKGRAHSQKEVLKRLGMGRL
ncbi:hypothetical protein HY995_03780 [Candidatus Micrarchaeota archaeon]|nr:hypothetical protein [Candidatus Micrarchaeota archaeon]MBI5177180.1 hypothetical protein [Candidatus Micrarchaeota archaeon]